MTATLTWRAGVEAALARAARAEAIPGLVVAVAFGEGAPEHLVSGADGHTGFTAALAWRDPEAEVAWAICSARLALEERPGSISAEYMKSLWCGRLYPAIGAAILEAAR